MCRKSDNKETCDVGAGTAARKPAAHENLTSFCSLGLVSELQTAVVGGLCDFSSTSRLVCGLNLKMTMQIMCLTGESS